MGATHDELSSSSLLPLTQIVRPLLMAHVSSAHSVWYVSIWPIFWDRHMQRSPCQRCQFRYVGVFEFQFQCG
eukprot:scaffold55_cov184-Skeletonema_marinoi.AAC.3